MKHIWRKPLLPGILVAVVLLGISFMAIFRQSINEDKKIIDEMYLNTELMFSVLPGINSDGTLRFSISVGDRIEMLEEIEKCFYNLSCNYSMREPIAAARLSMIYGTNDIAFFEETQEITIEWGEGYDTAAFQVLEDGKVPCLMDSLLMEVIGIGVGDTIVIAPNEGIDEDREKAPSFTLQIVGSYTNKGAKLMPYGLITTDEIFLSRDGRLLYNTTMMEKFCFYQDFEINIKPVYNREFERIEETLRGLIGDEYILYSNVRMLKQAVRPLEQKVELQEKLVIPLSVLFVLASCVVAYLTAISFRTEIFLRLLWGEPRWKVFVKMTASLCPHLVIAVLTGTLVLWGIHGGTWDTWALSYLGAEVAACLFTAAAATAIVSRQNLIQSYQVREE